MDENFEFKPNDDSFETLPSEPCTDDVLPMNENPPRERKMTNKQKVILISVGAAIFLALLGLIIGLVAFSGRSNEDDRILKNVFAGGVDLSGMTMEEAISALHVATDQGISSEPMTVLIYDGTLLLNPQDTKISLDVEAVAQAAYDYGRSGSNAENQQIQNNAHKRSYTIPLLPYLNLDLTRIRNTVDSYCEAMNSEYAESVISTIGTRPAYGDQSPKHQSMQITLGTPLRRLDAEDLYNQILDAYSMNELLLEYEAPEVLWPTKLNAQDIFDQYCTPAQDAVLDTSTYEVTPEIYGYGFHVEAVQKMLDDARPGETIEIPLSFIEPDVLAQDINGSLFEEKLTSCTITSAISDNARDANLLQSCNAINGYIVKPGETFSLLKVLGKINAKNGYAKAPVCFYNDTIMGGGISQTASALYHCVLHADLDVVERHNHKYTTDFIELGLDAYVDDGTNDLRFRNDTTAPIRIDASASRSTVTISLYSANPLGYNVSIRTEITDKELPDTSYQMLLPNNPQGYQDGDVMIQGLEGYQVSVHKEKTDLINGNILSTSAVSTNKYKKRDEVIARIGVFEDEEPTEPEETTPPDEITDTP